jgi:hypothetical protein
MKICQRCKIHSGAQLRNVRGADIECCAPCARAGNASPSSYGESNRTCYCEACCLRKLDGHTLRIVTGYPSRTNGEPGPILEELDSNANVVFARSPFSNLTFVRALGHVDGNIGHIARAFILRVELWRWEEDRRMETLASQRSSYGGWS